MDNHKLRVVKDLAFLSIACAGLMYISQAINSKRQEIKKVQTTGTAQSLPAFVELFPEEKQLEDREAVGYPPASSLEIIVKADNVDKIGRVVEDERKLNLDSIYEDLKRHEGMRMLAYDDSLGNRTIGVGFNLDRADAKKTIESLGLDFESIYEGRYKLNEKQVRYLMKKDVETSIIDARDYVGEEHWEELETEAKEIIINMAYNLGKTRLSKFVKLREALRGLNYSRAADEMRNSRWYSQVGNRSEELARRMESLDN